MLLNANNSLILCHICGMVSGFLFMVLCQLLSSEYTVVDVQLKSDNFEWQRLCLINAILFDGNSSHQN